MTSLDLTEFPSTAEADWRNKIAADLSRRGASTTLTWEPEPELVLDAVATKNTLAKEREQSSFYDPSDTAPEWTCVQYVPVRADGSDGKRVLAALRRSDLVLVEFDPDAIGSVIRAAADNNLQRRRIVIDGAAAEDCRGLQLPVDDVEFLSSDRLLRPWFVEEDARTIDPISGSDGSVTIDARDLRHAVDSVVIECGTIASAVDAHTRRSPDVRINIVSPIGPMIFLEMAKLRALRALLTRRDGNEKKIASVEVGEASRVRLWAIAGNSASSADRREHQIRLTFSAVAGILGGADCLVTMPHSAEVEDVALAANVPLILRHESDLPRAVGTMADSYYVGTAAAKIAARASALRDSVIAAGGIDTAAGRRILTEIVGRYKSAPLP